VKSSPGVITTPPGCCISQYLRSLRTDPIPAPAEESSSPLETLTFHQAVWFFLRDPADLDTLEQEQLAALQEASPQVAQAYRLVQAFTQMVRQRTGTQLVPWLNDVAQSQLPALVQFADVVNALPSERILPSNVSICPPT
jgi:hypothetical protein